MSNRKSPIDDESQDQLQSHQHPPVSINEERLRLFIIDTLATRDEHLRDHIRAEFKTLEDLIKSAFVQGDVHGHRLAHEADKKKSDRWEEIKAEFITKAFTSGALAAGAFVLLLVLEYIRGGNKP